MFNSSKKTTNNYTENTQITDQSYRYTDQSVNLDGGAIESAFGFAKNMAGVIEGSVNKISDTAKNAMYEMGVVNRDSLDFGTDTVTKALNTNYDTTRANLDFSGDTVNRALYFATDAMNLAEQSAKLAEDSTNNAMDFAFNTSKEMTAPGSDIAKYALIGAAIIVAAMVIKK